MIAFANIGATGLYLLFAWLLSAAIGSWVSERKGYGEKVGLTFGLLLSAAGLLIVLLLPGRPGSAWKQQGWLPPRAARAPERPGSAPVLNVRTQAAEDEGVAFRADGAIGKGFSTLDAEGSLTIADGRLALTKRTGQVIVEAPVSEIRAEAMRIHAGVTVRIFIGEDKYWVRPLAIRTFEVERLMGSVASLAGEALLGSATQLAADYGDIKRGRQMTEAVLTAIRAARVRAEGPQPGG